MSIEAVAWVLSSADTRSTTEVAVLLGLANHADAYGYYAFPSVPTLARYVKASERTVQRTLTEMESRGLIEQGDDLILSSTRIPKNYWPIVWNLRMGVGGTLLRHPDLEPDDTRSRGDKLTPLESRGDIHDSLGATPTSPKPYKEPSKSYESAGAERYSDAEPQIVTPLRRSSGKSRRSSSTRIHVAENSPSDTSRTIGIRATTDKAVRVRAQREAISRPDSGGGLAKDFGIRAAEAGLAGPQQVNGAALASRLTAWLRDENNPDTPQAIRAMMDEFFRDPKSQSDVPLWRRFLSEAPRLRGTQRASQPIDYRAAEQREWEAIRQDAARGDIRAQKALAGEDKPWRKSS